MLEKLTIHATILAFALLGVAGVDPVSKHTLVTPEDLRGLVLISVAGLFGMLMQLIKESNLQRAETRRQFLALLSGGSFSAIATAALLLEVMNVRLPFAIGVGIIAGYGGLDLIPGLSEKVLGRIGVKLPEEEKRNA